MKKQYLLVAFLICLFILMLLASPETATAQSGSSTPVPVYVDPDRPDGNEDGTSDHPYSTLEEGIAYAQAQPSGGTVYIEDGSGGWEEFDSYRGVTAGAGGTSIPGSTLYLLLGGLTLVLILSGWLFQRRSRHLQN